MKITGYKLREALKKWKISVDISHKQFQKSIFQFEEDEQIDPKKLSSDYQKAEEAIATLETAQQQYNLRISIDFEDKKVPLAYLVKLVGNAGRYEKMWRSAATNDGENRWGDNNTRNKDDILAKRMISIDESIKFANIAATRASKIRALIAQANAIEVELDIDSQLLE